MGGNVVDILYLVLDGHRVIVFQRRHGAGSATGTSTVRRAGGYDEHIAPKARDGGLYIAAHAHAHRDHGNDRPHADDDAKHGEKGPELIGHERSEGHLEALAKQHP